LIPINRLDIFDLIEKERDRQDTLHPLRMLKTSEDEDVNVVAQYLFLNDMMAVLIEEVGEVGKAMQGDGYLQDELIQVAAVCVRWLENIKET
jgi:NTP pyrophosphatase (non-canonical NTP hydrolase)